MGKGTIISGGAAGLYQVQVNFDRARIEAELARLATAIAEQGTAIDNLAAEITAAEADPALAGQLGELRSRYGRAKLVRAGMERRQAYLNSLHLSDPTLEAWCADLTEDLAGEVATIEVNGERERGLLIAPGYADGAHYNSAEHGRLQPVAASTPAGVFSNLALMPGWQKWRPTYRLGEITAKAGDLCDVALDQAAFSDRGSGLSANLNINQNTVGGQVTLEVVPINYMNCDGAAFQVGDRVVVHFIDQDWNDPQVIGFESNPRHCLFYVLRIKLQLQRAIDAGGDIWQDTGDYMALFWDLDNNQPLPVQKEDETLWDYPLSQTDAEGDFWDDLLNQYGAGVSLTPPAPLLNMVGLEDSPIQYDGNYLDFGAGRTFLTTASPMSLLGLGQTLLFINWDFDENGDYSEADAANYSNAQENSYGELDSFACDYAWSIIIPEPVQTGEVGVDWTTTANGSWADDWSDTAELPSGGFLPPYTVYGIGFQGSTLFPAFNFSDFRIRTLNSSGAAELSWALSVEWAGSGSQTKSFSRSDHSVRVAVDPDEYSSNGGGSVYNSSDYSGAGLATSPDGEIYDIGLAQLVGQSCHVSWSDGGVSPSLSGEFSRSVDYLFRAVALASDYSTSANYQALILGEAVSTGNKALTGAVTGEPEPAWNPLSQQWSWSWLNNLEEDAIQYSGHAVNYTISARAALCADADTQNPWELPANEDLEAQLNLMLSELLALYPDPNTADPGLIMGEDLNFWRLDFDIAPLVRP
jgi:hypothetical protein